MAVWQSEFLRWIFDITGNVDSPEADAPAHLTLAEMRRVESLSMTFGEWSALLRVYPHPTDLLAAAALPLADDCLPDDGSACGDSDAVEGL